MKYIALFLGIIATISGFMWFQTAQMTSIGTDLRTFISAQLSTSTPTNGYVLSTDGNINTWIPAAGGGSSKWTDEGTIIYPTTLESIRVPFIDASSTVTASTFVNASTTNFTVSNAFYLLGDTITNIATWFQSYLDNGYNVVFGNATTTSLSTTNLTVTGTATSTFSGPIYTGTNHIVTHGVWSDASDGLHIHAGNGTNVGLFGAGNTANSLFYGAVNIDGNTRLATSLTGPLRADSGVVSTNATGTLTETVTGLEFSATRDLFGGSAILSLTSGYSIPLTASTTEWANFYATPSTRITAGNGLAWSGNTLSATSSHAAVTLSGALDYITLVGQDIVRGAIDLATDITGVLGIANGGLGAAFTDPNADQIMFWDDSAGAIKSITSLVGAAISGTTLTINDVTCTDCLTSTEIGDEYLFNNGDVGTGSYDFGGATSFEMVNGAGPTVDTLGEFAFDTTDNQFLIATGTSARAIPTITRLWSATVASTSNDFVSGGRLPIPPHRDGVVVTEVHCFVDGGTSKAINLDTMAGGAQLDGLTCATTLTSDTAQSANNTLSAGALMALEFGATTGTVDYVTFSAWGYIIPE